jgi:Cd2+/Zn2+-exporting ATPase
LRRELEGDPAIEQLDFDIVRGHLHVRHHARELSVSQIIQRIAALGMHARPLTAETPEPAARQRDPRVWTTAAGALCMLAGFGWQWIQSGSFAVASGFHEPAAGLSWVTQTLYAAAVVLGGWFVAPKAWLALKRARADMNLLMGIAVVGAMLIGQWMEAAAVSLLFALSLLLEQWSMGRARRAIGTLIQRGATTARCRRPSSDEIVELPIEQVEIGQEVVVRPGERIPLDGTVIRGNSSVDQSAITGESMPVACGEGSSVYAGTINGEGLLEIRVTKTSTDTTLARIIRLVEQAQSQRAPLEQCVERFARYYTPAMLALAALICVVPPLLFSGSWHFWLYNALVLLVIACPCALVISTPVTIVSALTSAAHHGVLVKGGRYLEAAADLQAVALDKTGTLTRGRPEVVDIQPLNDHTVQELLLRAVSLEAHSTHPIARAIMRRARHDQVVPAEVTEYRVLNGRGAEATFRGQNYWIGSRRLMAERISDSEQTLAQQIDSLEDEGKSVIVVGSQRHVCGLITVSDTIRQEAVPVVRQLKALGIRSVVMLTGDNRSAARRVGQAIGVDRQLAEALPEDKLREIDQLMQQFGSVAMVGDGVNDAPAMARATLGLAMGAAGTDTAIETSDVALMSDELSKIPWLIQHARRARRVVVQNIAFALGLKAVFVLLTLAGLSYLWLAIAADTGASLLVVLNGMRLLQASRV